MPGCRPDESRGGCLSLPALLFTSETQMLLQLPLGGPLLSISLFCSHPPARSLNLPSSFHPQRLLHAHHSPSSSSSSSHSSAIHPSSSDTASRSRPALFCMCGGGGVMSGGGEVRGHGESKPAAVERKRLGRRPACWPGSLVSMPEAGTNWEYGCCCGV